MPYPQIVSQNFPHLFIQRRVDILQFFIHIAVHRTLAHAHCRGSLPDRGAVVHYVPRRLKNSFFHISPFRRVGNTATDKIYYSSLRQIMTKYLSPARENARSAVRRGIFGKAYKSIPSKKCMKNICRQKSVAINCTRSVGILFCRTH